MEEHDNATEIYSYTEKHIEGINKSIDALGSKLISTLGFSGVLLKFISDMAINSKYPFWFVALSSGALVIAIGCCVSGLYPANSGCAVTPSSLLSDEDSWWYSAPSNLYKLRIVKQWYKHIDSLNENLDRRQSCLRLAIGYLTFVAVLFCVINIVLGVH